MKKNLKVVAAALALAGGSLVFAGAANASAIIDNGTIQMGINDEGHLNVYGTNPSSGEGTNAVGLRYMATNAESTAPGCLCEGWGAGLVSAGVSGYANVSSDGGAINLSLLSFTSTASTATSVVRIGTTLEVTHYYHPSTVANLYQVDVSLKNISGTAFAAGDLVYRRVMDWDIEPTAFDEHVTIAGVPGSLGVANGTNLRGTGDNGFNTANPLVTTGRDMGFGCGENVNFADCGPQDHGALFDFEFEALADGATRQFTTFYGAAGNETDALAALAAVGAGIYSLGQTADDPATGTPNTFMFGFGSKGGILTPPPTGVPEPGSLALLGLGLAGLAGLRRRQKQA